MCYGLLESDHALVMCDLHLQFLVGSRATLLMSLTQPIISNRIFPRSSKWSEGQWAKWASRLDDPANVSMALTSPIKSLASELPSSHSDCETIRKAYGEVSVINTISLEYSVFQL